MLGLGKVESSARYTDIDHAFYNATGRLYVFESGIWKGTFGSLSPTDTLSIEVSGQQLTYKHNDTALRTVTLRHP